MESNRGFLWSKKWFGYSTSASGYKKDESSTANPNTLVNKLISQEFWNLVEEAFVRPRNLTLYRKVFLLTKN